MSARSVCAAAAVAVARGSARRFGPPALCRRSSATLASLSARAAALERDITLLEDENAIEKLQRVYGFYSDKQMWTQAADLFAANGTIEVGGARCLCRASSACSSS